MRLWFIDPGVLHIRKPPRVCKQVWEHSLCEAPSFSIMQFVSCFITPMCTRTAATDNFISVYLDGKLELSSNQNNAVLCLRWFVPLSSCYWIEAKITTHLSSTISCHLRHPFAFVFFVNVEGEWPYNDTTEWINSKLQMIGWIKMIPHEPLQANITHSMFNRET